jgi:pullulanase
MDSARSQIVDLADPSLRPEGWADLVKPAFDGHPTVYELHVRDFSAHDPTVPTADVGTFKAFTHHGSDGMRHLAALADAGLTHLHLLPTNDIATIPEDPARQVSPEIERPQDPASEEPQAIQQATSSRQPFNWGYDPLHFTAPEGSYSTDPDGPARIVEFREMVQSLNGIGLRVVADVVYNHTHAAGQAGQSILDRVVPGYYQRLDAVGGVETSTCCPNTASEHRMMERLMIDSVVDWARHYKVDGFRFDLMGHHTKANMLAVRAALDALTLADDGVDGAEIVLYGEGWDFGEVVDGRRFEQATQANMAGTEIGTFNDRLRDGVRGGTPFSGLMEQGWATGLGTAPNGADGGAAADQRDRALSEQLWVKLGLAGNLADYEIEAPDGRVLRGDEVLYGGAPAGYAASPLDNVVYVSKHDNETLFDAIQLKAPADLPIDERVRMQNLALSVVAFSQGVPFFHAGSDLLRSKSLDRNSYDSGDYFNRLDWSGQDNNWGVGLPPAADNEASWDIHRDVLRTRPGPDPKHIAANAAHLRELLEIRGSSALFALETAGQVRDRVRFHRSGQDAVPGLIAMQLVGDEHDLLVVFNAGPDEVAVPADGLTDSDWTLHPVQRASLDTRVRAAAFADGLFTVPARTTAVFISEVLFDVGQAYEASFRQPSRDAVVDRPLLAWFTVTDVAGDVVTGADVMLRVTDAAGGRTTISPHDLPAGRYFQHLRVQAPGPAEVAVLTASGHVLGATTVDVRPPPSGDGG